jgi:single-strand DNA-binding protein
VRGEEGWSEVADWHSIRLWEQQAELCLRYVHKGSVIAVEGTLRHDSWTDASNNRRQVTYVVAERLHFVNLGNRKQPEAVEARPEGRPAEPVEAGDEAPF